MNEFAIFRDDFFSVVESHSSSDKVGAIDRYTPISR